MGSPALHQYNIPEVIPPPSALEHATSGLCDSGPIVPPTAVTYIDEAGNCGEYWHILESVSASSANNDYNINSYDENHHYIISIVIIIY